MPRRTRRAGSLVQALPTRAAFAYLTDGCGPEVPRERLDAAADRAIALSARFPSVDPWPAEIRNVLTYVLVRLDRHDDALAQLRLIGPYATSFPWGFVGRPARPLPGGTRGSALGTVRAAPLASRDRARRTSPLHGPLGFSVVTTVRLPLFPLNSALFPGLVLPLNVFEERYRAMMRDLLKTPEDESRRFAVVAIRDGHEVAPSSHGLPDQTALPERGPAAGFGDAPLKAFHDVGCVADAATIRERADGTFEVLATGTTRVKLLSVDASGPFLTAELQELPEDPGDEAGALAEGVLRAFRQYQKRLAGARERSLTTGADLPDDPSVVSYLVAAAMMLDTPTKQRLLQAPDTASRLRDELKLLRAETAIIRSLPSLPASDLTRGPTSLN